MLASLVASLLALPHDPAPDGDLRDSVVKILVTQRISDVQQP